MVTRAQLISAGVGGAAVDSRVRRGALLVVHRGVYAVGHAALRDEGFWLAAVLASGPGAVLSHLSAALLWGMRVRRGPPIHLTATRRSGPAGVVVHETRNLSRADITVERGIRVTTPARTVIDCADTVTYEELRILANHGVRLDAGAIRRAQQRAPKRRGAKNIARLLGDDVRTRSALERRLGKLCRDAGLPAPLSNERVCGKERDAVWPGRRLVVEVDGGRFHTPKPAREAGYERDAQLVVAGWRVARFTYDQVFYDGVVVVARLRALLA